MEPTGKFSRSRESEVFATFIGYLIEPSPPSREEIALTQALRPVYFLLDDRNPNNLRQFLSYTLPRILAQLQRTTVRVDVEYRGQVRGRVSWPATHKARCTGDYTPDLYHCRQSRTFFNTPENQLLKYLLEEIDRRTREVPAAIRNGFCSGTRSRQAIPVIDKFQSIEMKIRETLRNAYLRQIDSLSVISAPHLQRAENCRMEEYAAVATIYREYRELIERLDWHPFEKEGGRFLLFPNQATEETDVWIRIAANITRTYQQQKGVYYGGY